MGVSSSLFPCWLSRDSQTGDLGPQRILTTAQENWRWKYRKNEKAEGI